MVFKPLAHGVDVSVNALTKHVSGSSDYVVGSLAVNDRSSSAIALYHSLFGVSVSNEQCADLLRSLKTTLRRLELSHASTLKVVKLLQQSPNVGRIYCPSISTSVGHYL